VDVSRMRRRITYGVTGLFVVLFALTGLAFSYGIGHPPPSAACVLHAAADGDGTGLLALDQDAPGPAPAVPPDVCLFLAVLIALLALGAATRPRRWVVRRKRSGWTLGVPAAHPAPARSRTALQVLRL
jgi:hypothetical protein